MDNLLFGKLPFRVDVEAEFIKSNGEKRVLHFRCSDKLYVRDDKASGKRFAIPISFECIRKTKEQLEAISDYLDAEDENKKAKALERLIMSRVIDYQK